MLLERNAFHSIAFFSQYIDAIKRCRGRSGTYNDHGKSFGLVFIPNYFGLIRTIPTDFEKIFPISRSIEVR